MAKTRTLAPAGTDLGLAFDGQAPEFPVIDVPQAHADHLVRLALD